MATAMKQKLLEAARIQNDIESHLKSVYPQSATLRELASVPGLSKLAAHRLRDNMTSLVKQSRAVELGREGREKKYSIPSQPATKPAARAAEKSEVTILRSRPGLIGVDVGDLIIWIEKKLV